ncbi:acyltransferase family protein, partial [Acinetobacter baumannii]
ILLVLVLHFSLSYPLTTSALNNILAPNFIHEITRNGNYGVTIFFVISGFLITATTIDRFGALNKIRLDDFYSLRIARILPCLLL